MSYAQTHIRDPQKLMLRFGEPLHKQKEQTYKAVKKPYVSALFAVSEVFAVAKVKLCNTQRSCSPKFTVKLSLPTLPKAKLHYT